MSIIEVKGNKYECGRLSAVTQFHVTRRLGPVLVVAGISIEMIRTGMKLALDDLVSMAGPVIEVLSKMSDADTNYILTACLSAVKRESAGKFAPITADKSLDLMFADIDMPTMLRLVVEVLKENLGNFLTEPSGALDSLSS